jgi:hypothetical protein
MHSSDSVVGPIRDWTDGFLCLKHHAEAARGAVESDLHVGDRQRWPRTTGADVICIAALIDPCVRSLLSSGRFGTATVAQRWGACLDDLERFALPNPAAEYLDNRRFWDDLLTIAVHLSSAFEQLPTQEEWEQVLASLREPLRNGVPKDVPFGPFSNVFDYGDLFAAQKKHLMERRGVELRAPEPGMTGGEKSIPRTTYQDVLSLRDFWDRALDSAKEVLGHASVVEQWRAASADVDALGKATSDRTTLYPKNNAFWRALSRVAVQVTVAEEAPSTARRVLDSAKVGILGAPATVYNTVKTVATGTAEAAGEVATSVAGGINKVFRGLFSGAGPYVLGGGLLGGYLLLRSRKGQ